MSALTLSSMAEDDQFLRAYDIVRSRLPLLVVQTFDGVSGEGIAKGLARVMSEVRRRMRDQKKRTLFRDATGPEHASGTVTLAWDAPTGTAYEVTIVVKTRWGADYTMTIERSAAAASGNVVIPATAAWAGEWHNVPDNQVMEWGFDPTNEDSVTWDVGTVQGGKDEFLAAVIAGTIRFVSASRMEGGSMGTLDLKAAGRGFARALGESDESLRNRAAQIPQDAVTPAGIKRAVDKALGYDGAILVENHEYGFAFGVGAFGVDPFGSGPVSGVVMIPEGSDVAAIEALVERIKAFGTRVDVLEYAPDWEPP